MEIGGEELDIEIIDPEAVILDDGSMEITLIPDANIADLADFNTNLAELLEEGDLRAIADDMMGLVEADTDSRKEWAEAYVKGLDVLGFNASHFVCCICGILGTWN